MRKFGFKLSRKHEAIPGPAEIPAMTSACIGGVWGLESRRIPGKTRKTGEILCLKTFFFFHNGVGLEVKVDKD